MSYLQYKNVICDHVELKRALKLLKKHAKLGFCVDAEELSDARQAWRVSQNKFLSEYDEKKTYYHVRLMGPLMRHELVRDYVVEQIDQVFNTREFSTHLTKTEAEKAIKTAKEGVVSTLYKRIA